MKITIIAGALAIMFGSAAAQADGVGIGLGLSWNFISQGPAAGIKLFSSREKDKAAASIGVDYLFSSSTIRPNIGAAYIGKDLYAGADFGYNPDMGQIDFATGLGLVNSKDRQ